ncbi:hypothetical protein [Novosphingobium sp. BL-52-GroH]|uniref:hypothetical protein n=1 Tax=Novosphingobium sp. BL-52-GroH TaxID=3349877 RepID=UPI00384F1618
MSAGARLPDGFGELEPFLDSWGRHTTQERLAARCERSMDEIGQFYDAMTARAEEALGYIDGFPLDDLPEQARNLLALVLGLAQAHIAVEIHRQPRAPGTPWPNSIEIVRGLALLG